MQPQLAVFITLAKHFFPIKLFSGRAYRRIRIEPGENCMTSTDGLPATKTETLRQVEDTWLRDSEPEKFHFEMFAEPALLRRSKHIQGGLAELDFGRYQGFDKDWVDDDGVVWLQMITSDVAGNGQQLLQAIKTACGRANLAIVGTPSPLKPRDWDQSRPFSYDVDKLTYWYMKQGFKVIQDGYSTRVVFASQHSTLKVRFSFD
jgi:hypothetical protein